MIDATFVKAIQDLVPADIITVGERTFFSKPVTEMGLPLEPKPECLDVSTLDGFIAFCRDLDAFTDVEETSDAFIIHILNYGQVSLLGPVAGVHRQRDKWIQATAIQPYKLFKFGEYYDAESFIVSLQSIFVDTADRAEILRLVSNLTDSKIQTSRDDGFSQTATVKTGLALAEAVSIPNPVTLAPYRTFPELSQPHSKFTLRLQQSDRPGGLPKIALFESDGGYWKIESVRRVKEYILDNLTGFKVLA